MDTRQGNLRRTCEDYSDHVALLSFRMGDYRKLTAETRIARGPGQPSQLFVSSRPVPPIPRREVVICLANIGNPAPTCNFQSNSTSGRPRSHVALSCATMRYVLPAHQSGRCCSVARRSRTCCSRCSGETVAVPFGKAARTCANGTLRTAGTGGVEHSIQRPWIMPLG